MLRAWRAEDLGSGFGDFFDTACAMQTVSEVVCVDTSVAHLAGALGKPTRLLLNEPAAVRWMLGTRRSPWYPTMRLYRKRRDEPWSAIVAEVLKDFASAQRNGGP